MSVLVLYYVLIFLPNAISCSFVLFLQFSSALLPHFPPRNPGNPGNHTSTYIHTYVNSHKLTGEKFIYIYRYKYLDIDIKLLFKLYKKYGNHGIQRRD